MKTAKYTWQDHKINEDIGLLSEKVKRALEIIQ